MDGSDPIAKSAIGRVKGLGTKKRITDEAMSDEGSNDDEQRTVGSGSGSVVRVLSGDRIGGEK